MKSTRVPFETKLFRAVCQDVETGVVSVIYTREPNARQFDGDIGGNGLKRLGRSYVVKEGTKEYESMVAKRPDLAHDPE